MTMRKGVARALLAATAAVLAIGFGASTALAAVTLTVKVSGGGSVTASSPKVVLADSTHGASVTCASAISGSIPNGTTKGSSPVRIGTFGKVSMSRCTGPLSVTVTFGRLPYRFTVDSMTVNGKTDVILTSVDAMVSMPGCSFAATGSVPGYFTNSTHILTLTPKLPVAPMQKAQLTIGNVNGCAGLVNNGDRATVMAKYKIDHLVINAS
jgi:hypothetical protein